jgi:hypothetical protein
MKRALASCLDPAMPGYVRHGHQHGLAASLLRYRLLTGGAAAVQGRRKGGVLVHCYAGQSRSVAFILAYLCACQGLSLPDAYRVVLAARPCARPNAGERRSRDLAFHSCVTRKVVPRPVCYGPL